MADTKLYLVKDSRQSAPRYMFGLVMWTLTIFALGVLIGVELQKLRGH